MTVRVLTGVPGSGKTTYCLDVVERELRSGIKWHEIGFCSFSRSACLTAAERAAKLTGEDPEKLQKQGWFRTLHSAALRCLGVDHQCILDLDSKDGEKFLIDAIGCVRGGEKGTAAGFVESALGAWDYARAKLLLLKDDADPDFSLSRLIERLETGVQDGRTHGTHEDTRNTHENECVSARFSQCSDCSNACPDTQTSIPIGDLELNNNFIINVNNIKKITGEFCLSVCPKIEMSSENTAYSTGQTKNSVCHCLSCVSRKDNQDTRKAENAGDLSYLKLIHTHQAMIKSYERQKRLYGRLDFTDILMNFSGVKVDDDLTYSQCMPIGIVPDELEVLIFDEHQDASPILQRCAERLGEAARDVYYAGDGYQAIFGFSGAVGAIFKGLEREAKNQGNRILLNRSWRNTDSVIDWGEQVLREDKAYEERYPFGEAGEGSVALVSRADWEGMLPSLANTDTMILARAWFALDPVKRRLDELAIPWRSCQEDRHSKWESPAKIAFTIVMRMLGKGERISEQDFRRIIADLPQKWNGVELFVRGAKAKWKKMQCDGEPVKTLGELSEWGATEALTEFVQQGKWKSDVYLLLDHAISKYGVQAVYKPAIQLGSVHAVKGLEARNVFCLSTSTPKIRDEGNEDDERCLKYVAITRAKENYRLVVDQNDIARGRPLFWAAPAGCTKYLKTVDNLREEVGDDRIADPDEDHSVVQDEWEGLGLDRETSWGDLQQEWDAGSHPVSQGEVRRTGSEATRTETETAAGGREGEDQEEWWDL